MATNSPNYDALLEQIQADRDNMHTLLNVTISRGSSKTDVESSEISNVNGVMADCRTSKAAQISYENRLLYFL